MAVEGKRQSTTLSIILIYLLLYYSWLIYFDRNEEMLKIGGNAFQLIAPIISAYWLFSECHRRKGRERLFWLSFGLGNIFYIVAQLIWNYYEWILHIDAPAAGLADIIWCLQYVAYFIGMLLKRLDLSGEGKTLKLLLDILVVMVVAATLSLEYIIDPILKTSDGWEVFIYIFYPVGDLGLLLGALTIAYASEKASSHSLNTLLSLGIVAQIIADTYYSYAAPLGKYHTGNLIDPIWALGLLLIGTAVLNEDKVASGAVLKKELAIIHLPATQRSVIDYIYFALPYAGVIFLFLLMLTRVVLDVIFIGVCISVGMLIIRQIITLIENGDLLAKYKILTNELDSKVKERTQELEYLAYHDQLTGIPNRRYFETNLKEIITRSKIYHHSFALLLLDLDRFKQINDVMGHGMGDYLLIEMANRLTYSVVERAKVFRLGGDEFTILIPDTNEKEVEELARNINKAVSRPLLLDDEVVKISTSIGISMFPDNGDNPDTLFKQADVAMYEAKSAGKDNYQFYRNEMKTKISKRITIENGLRKALEEQSFSLVYQPIVNTDTEEVSGAEALLRWNHPTLGNLPPLEFIPVAEETGLIVEIGYWIIETACFEAKSWHGEEHFLEISINISVAQFKQEDFVEKVKAIIDKVNLNPRYIHFEITESVAILNAEMVISKLEELNSLGIQFSIDDFGTGYSSLNYLNKFPLTILKIDKSFIDGIDINSQNKQIVSTIINLAAHLKVDVIAEGVETSVQVETLRSLGCQNAQGYLYSKPLQKEKFAEFIKTANLRNKATETIEYM